MVSGIQHPGPRQDGADSLRIARAVSDAVVQVVRRVLDRAPPAS